MEQKKPIRQTYRKRRDGLSRKQVQEWSAAMTKLLTASPLFCQAKTILCYYPLGNEANLLIAAQKALNFGKTVGFPKTEGEVIRFYRVRDLDTFREGPFHVMEPVSQELLQEEAPLILVPGVAFDEKKNRMGYGKGYYDRYGAYAPNAVRIGISYEMQLAKHIPAGPYDIPMDYLLTERRLF